MPKGKDGCMKRGVWIKSIRVRTSGKNPCGVYLYVVRKAINYPIGKSKIVYVGKGKPLSARLQTHFSHDMKQPIFPEHRTQRWFCQNYYLNGIPFDIFLRFFPKRKVDDAERLFLGLFADLYGAVPICNGALQWRKTQDAFQKNRVKIAEIKQTIKRFDAAPMQQPT